ncbi:MAG: hypothetical protein ACLUSL_02235 [Ruminococcus sp.]
MPSLSSIFALVADTDQRAESIENINEQEREDDNDEVYDADCARSPR